MELAVAAVTALAGAALGEAFRLLSTSVIEAHREASEQTPVFNDLKSTLECYGGLVQAIENCDINVASMEGLDNFKVKLEEGRELIQKRPKTSCMQSGYVGELKELGASLQTHFDTLKAHVDVNMSHSVNNSLKSIYRSVRTIQVLQQTGNLASYAVPNPPPYTVGLQGPLEDLKMKFLLDDQVSMYVLTAPGGYGKTTLAQKFCQDKQVKEKFKDNICFVKVSKNPEVDIIVQQLCHSRKTNEPAFHNEPIRRLEAALEEARQNPLLLVLDDVWDPSAASLLDKCYEFKRPNYKFLVTSRDHFRRYHHSKILDKLSPEDSMSLFCDANALQKSKFYISKDMVKKIVELCKGHPLAITTIGKELNNQHPATWDRRKTELSAGSSILDSEKWLLVTLQSSLDAFVTKALAKERFGKKSSAKECFIDLGSFPEDRRISVAALIDMWAELYGYSDKSSIDDLYFLSASNLANIIVTRNATKDDTDDYYTEHYVTQHDMLRSLAIHQTSNDSIGDCKEVKRLSIDIRGDDIPKRWTEHKSRPSKSSRLLSISTDEAFSSDWHSMNPPEAEVLVLNLQSKNYAFPKFKKKMTKSLKVLVVTNYGALPAEVINFTSLSSLSHLKRIRLHRISIPPITKRNMKLKNLQKMSLFMCSMGQEEGPFKFFEAFPSLEEINIDYCSDLKELPADICSLIHLKKLSITNCHKLSALPESIGDLINLEVLRLRSCTDLLEFPDSIRKLTKLKVLDISKCYTIKELPEHIGEMGCLETLNMRECSRLKELPESIFDLESLIDVICDHHTIGLWDPYMSNLRNTIEIREVEETYSLDWLHQ